MRAARLGKVGENGVRETRIRAIAVVPFAQRRKRAQPHARHGGAGRIHQARQRFREAQRRQVNALGIAHLAHVAIGEAVAHIQHQGGADDQHIVERQALAGRAGVEAPLRTAVAILPTAPIVVMPAEKQPVPFAELMVEPSQVRVVLLLADVHIVVVVGPIVAARDIRRGIEIHQV